MPVTCIPSEPVKAWEFTLDCDLPILNITQGDFFTPYQTFTRLNSSYQYSLILGGGNITRSGVLCTYTIRAGEPGFHLLTLKGLVGVTNETMYLPLTIINGSITVNTLHLWRTPVKTFTGLGYWINLLKTSLKNRG